MIRILDEQSMIVLEHGLRLFEANPMLAFVLGMLSLIPLEADFYHENVL